MKDAMDRRTFLKLAAIPLAELLSRKMAKQWGAQAEASTSGCLRIVSVRPERPHLVAPGSITTFVVAATNPSTARVPVSLSVRSLSEGWSARVCDTDRLFRPIGQRGDRLTFGLGGGERRYFVVELGPERGQAEGQVGRIEVGATIEGRLSGTVIVQGKVRSAPKIYFVAYDGLGREYLKLDRQGKYEQVDIDPLMPHVRQFLADSTCLLRARSQVPSLSDPNHVSALTGSWPGTTGLICMRHFYCGRDEYGNPVKIPGDSRILRWGSEGRPVKSIFHVAKDPAMGGDRDALNATIWGKEWIGHYFRDLQRTVDIIVGGLIYPDYLPPPSPYVLGDPLSDDDAEQDRDGVNLNPRPLFKMIPNPPYGTAGEAPNQFPDDRWVMEGALRIIAAEDPDILYIQPGAVDLVQHHAGAADRAEEWCEGSYPEALWEDVNRYTLHANRDPVLDVVREADATFGLLVETLQARGTYEESLLIFLADHGQRTYMDKYLNWRQVCTEAGIPEEAFDFVSSGAETIYLWLSDPAYADAIESALEGFTIYHPAFGEEVHPFLVLNREEMDTGVDGVVGQVAADGGPKRGELYSTWYIDYPAEDTSKILWPDLIIFTLGHYQVPSSNPQLGRVVGGHGGVGWPQNIPLAIHGPGIRRGFFDEQEAYLVDVVPTLYHLLGWTVPENVDGRVLSEILLAA